MTATPEPQATLDTLVDTITARGIGVTRLEPGDALILIVPDADDAAVDEMSAALTALMPDNPHVVLLGVAGAAIAPAPPAIDQPAARTPAYVHRLLDHLHNILAVDNPPPLNFTGAAVPADVQARLTGWAERGLLPGTHL